MRAAEIIDQQGFHPLFEDSPRNEDLFKRKASLRSFRFDKHIHFKPHNYKDDIAYQNIMGNKSKDENNNGLVG